MCRENHLVNCHFITYVTVFGGKWPNHRFGQIDFFLPEKASTKFKYYLRQV